MIHRELHKKPIALDRNSHRALKLRTDIPTSGSAAGLNSFFVASAEFGDASKEYAIVFLPAGNDPQGKPQAAPVVVLGLSQGENMMLDGDRWTGRYQPALIRAYPFMMGRADNDQLVLCIDESWKGWSTTEGQPLLDEQGEPTKWLKDIQTFVENIEAEVERTRRFCQFLLEKKLLSERRFDATLPSGQKLSAEGFMTVDDDALAKLPDADIVEMHRNGALELIHAHRLSLPNMRRLVDLRVERTHA